MGRRTNFVPDKGETIAVTCIRMPASLRDKIKDEAARTNCSMGLIMVGALEAFIATGGAKEIADA